MNKSKPFALIFAAAATTLIDRQSVRGDEQVTLAELWRAFKKQPGVQRMLFAHAKISPHMTTITILPEKADAYRAFAGDKESTGRTAGEALDNLTSQLSDDEGGTLVIVQNRQADKFFNQAQQSRLTKLMERRRTHALSKAEETELESLVEAELDGARLRAEALRVALNP